jgi:putative selenate reductase
LLKTGGYLRLLQYLESTRNAFEGSGASTIDEFILNSAGSDAISGDVQTAARLNLHHYASCAVRDRMLKKDTFFTSHSKTSRKLGLFDCIEAPCADECPVNQKVPQYMQAVREGDFTAAVQLTRADNPIPSILGRVCDHLCEPVCIRTHLDEPLAIRHIKRFIMEQEENSANIEQLPPSGKKVAIIGAGPGGMAAALELAQSGSAVEIFEMHPYAGGMVGGAIPEYRLPREVIDQDLRYLESLGVKIHYNTMAGRDIHLSQLRRNGFDDVVIMVGAQLGKKLGLEGEDCEGVMDALHFLRRSREGRPLEIGQRIGIIGAGDTAMDCARTAWRHSEGRVSVIYRRTIDQMPADREEVKCLLEEGIEVIELAKPQELLVEQGKLRAMRCRRMKFTGDRDASGRKIPMELHHSDPDSEFEVPLDTLILAISQHAILDFFDQEPVALNRRGYIEADPVTFETSVPGVYAGGDVVNDGPSSIVEAAADGKAIAGSILRRHAGVAGRTTAAAFDAISFDSGELLRRRSQREWRIPIPHSPVEDRKNFREVVHSYRAQQARAEAARCLDCHRYCSLCVSVCPNLALQTFQSEPFSRQLPLLRFKNNEIQIEPGSTYQVRQAHQILLLTDFCNECGNCTTFCPTAGEPYRDKPRLYLDRTEFEDQSDNAFMVFRDGQQWAMDARWGGATHRIELNGKLDYSGPSFRAHIDPVTFEVERVEPGAGPRDGDLLSLEPCAAMYVLLQGLRQSMPHIPAAWPAERAKAGRISQPKYEE